MEKYELLENLNFGNVDAESESNLVDKFVMTKDFKKFISSDKPIVLGTKGAGKSAVFQMF